MWNRAQLVEIARAACDGSVVFQNTSFEDWPLLRGAFDLVFAAQSFHWVDQSTGYRKAGEALCGGGTLALFWNRRRHVPSPLRSQLDALYAQCAPGLEEWTPADLVEVEKSIAECIAATELFDTQSQAEFLWSDRLVTQHYVRLLETHSDHATLPKAERKRLLEGVTKLVDSAGGEIDAPYQTVVHLAKRRTG